MTDDRRIEMRCKESAGGDMLRRDDHGRCLFRQGHEGLHQTEMVNQHGDVHDMSVGIDVRTFWWGNQHQYEQEIDRIALQNNWR